MDGPGVTPRGRVTSSSTPYTPKKNANEAAAMAASTIHGRMADGQNWTRTGPRSSPCVSKYSLVLKFIMPAMMLVGMVWVALL